MNISELFEMQKKLDADIEEKKNLKGQDLTDFMIMGLQVELGEAANEWRWFKVWSNDRKTREGLLVELVDCLHFILSIGYRCGYEGRFLKRRNHAEKDDQDAFHQFRNLFEAVGKFSFDNTGVNYRKISYWYQRLVSSLGFTWEQITEAYMEKNKINLDRQATGY